MEGKGDGGCRIGVKHPSRLCVRHVVMLVVVAFVSLVAFYETVTSPRVLGLSAYPFRLDAAGDKQWRSNLLTGSEYGTVTIANYSGYSGIANVSEFLEFVMSEPGEEHEKHVISEILETGALNPQWTEQARVAGRPSRLPLARYAPFWPQFQTMLRERLALKRCDPTVLQSLLVTIKEPIDNYRQSRHPTSKPPQQQRFASCAVVGNSGILLRSEYGKAIDAHEAVVRLNNAWARGFEKYVGLKTTISFMTSNVFHNCARRLRCICQSYDDNVAIVTYISQVPHLLDLALCRSEHAAPLLVTDPRFDALTARIAKWYSVREFVARTGKRVSDWPWRSPSPTIETFHHSSGMQAVIMALSICESVNLYGFGKAKGVKHHYHSAQVEELDIHDYAAEYTFYDELASPATRDTIPLLRDAGIPFLLCVSLDSPSGGCRRQEPLRPCDFRPLPLAIL